ncbi:retrovirus-related pol polyprotein from transposon TNT 1-94 [Tanacetum coccineum]|uniref:Retrovirus-related pol polyprotein from transposon TNT 1-94 n=1 Tax=Tanacetum coccineum TaxID=301880 RepID=A0ABQ5CAQ6_9ASTR
MDVNTAFLNCPLKEGSYAAIPKGFIESEFPNHVYRLKKALYDLKQAPRAWKGLCNLTAQSTRLAFPTLYGTYQHTYGQTPQRDADQQVVKMICKSLIRRMQFLGGKLVEWSSKKQDCTGDTTAEAEYVSCLLLWLK